MTAVQDPTDQNYEYIDHEKRLRTAVSHEVGHAMNLFHTESDYASTSLLAGTPPQTWSLDSGGYFLYIWVDFWAWQNPVTTTSFFEQADKIVGIGGALVGILGNETDLSGSSDSGLHLIKYSINPGLIASVDTARPLQVWIKTDSTMDWRSFDSAFLTTQPSYLSYSDSNPASALHQMRPLTQCRPIGIPQLEH